MVKQPSSKTPSREVFCQVNVSPKKFPNQSAFLEQIARETNQTLTQVVMDALTLLSDHVHYTRQGYDIQYVHPTDPKHPQKPTNPYLGVYAALKPKKYR